MLNGRREKFCREYLVDLNQTQAARRAGYQKPEVTGSKLMKDPKIQEYLTELKKEGIEATKYSFFGVLEELFAVGFCNLTNFLTIGKDAKDTPRVEVKDLQAMSNRETAAIKSLTIGEGGNVKVLLHDKVGALKILAELYREEIAIKHLTDRGYRVILGGVGEDTDRD